MSFDSFIVKRKVKIKRKEGNTGKIVFTVPETIPLAGMKAIFQVRDTAGNHIFTKFSDVATEIDITLQVITVYLDGSETIGYKGIHEWELLIYDSDDTSTIGEGPFEITKRVVMPVNDILSIYTGTFQFNGSSVTLTKTTA